jgi:hypothetical protein
MPVTCCQSRGTTQYINIPSGLIPFEVAPFSSLVWQLPTLAIMTVYKDKVGTEFFRLTNRYKAHLTR